MRRLVTVAVLHFSFLLGASAQTTKRPAAPVAAVSTAPQVFVRDASFQSAALGRTMKYRVILPVNYENATRRYPVLYLLHGLTGSYVDWESRTHITQYAQPLQLIIVMPDGEDSWYTNSASDPNAKFETYVVEDLIKEVERKYRVISTRHGRAIAGLSMGGYGAMKIALKYPGLFAFAGSFSGALEGANLASTTSNPKFRDAMLAIYGPADSPTRAENNVFTLAAKAQPERMPYFYVDCGASDGLLKSSRDFVDLLNKQKIAYEYHEVPGAHTWQYWDTQVQLLLASLVRHMDLH